MAISFELAKFQLTRSKARASQFQTASMRSSRKISRFGQKLVALFQFQLTSNACNIYACVQRSTSVVAACGNRLQPLRAQTTIICHHPSL